MTRPKGGLGRGLATLIPTGPTTNAVSTVLLANAGPRPDWDAEDARSARPTLTSLPGSVSRETGRETPLEVGVRYAELRVADIRPNPRNPRTVFDDDALVELVHSIKEFGLLQPIVVRPAETGYELVMGERRWRAAEKAGLTAIPALIRRTEDADMLRDALLENIHRANLNPLEEAAAYQQLLDEFEVTHEELATRLGRSRPVISNTIRLLKLPVMVQRRVAAGVLSAGHARALLSLDDPGAQEELASRVVAEGLSVRGTEEAVLLMAGKTVRTRRSTGKRTVLPDLAELADRLSDALDTRVRIDMGRQKGRMTVEFASVDDLHRIVDAMAPAASSPR